MYSMSLQKISKYLIDKRCSQSFPSKHLSSCSGSKGEDSDDKKNTDQQAPSESSCKADDNPCAPSMYDRRKYGHSLPCDNVTPQFETLPNIPTGIFRCTQGETLGRGANKSGSYRNPEYFSYQHMTFYDIHLILRQCRQPSPVTGRKP